MSKKRQKKAKPPYEDLEVQYYVKREGDNIAYDESEDILIHDGVVYERVDKVELDVNLIPDHVRDELAAATLEFVRNTLRQPGGREMLDARIEARKARKAAEALMKGGQACQI